MSKILKKSNKPIYDRIRQFDCFIIYVLLQERRDMMFNYNLLNNRIAQVCGSQQEFARRLGISFQELQERMLGKDGGFLASEMQKGIEILSIPITHAVKYFF